MGRLSPHGIGPKLDACDLNGHFRSAANLNRFFDGIDNLGAFVAHVRYVSPAVASHDFGQSDELFGRAVGTGLAIEPGRETKCAFAHCALDKLAHPVHFIRSRGTLVIGAHDLMANCPMSDESRDVQRWGLLIERQHEFFNRVGAAPVGA